MQKLSAENIQFIQNYLENSGVEYLDIKIETTDHIASEIETKWQEAIPVAFIHSSRSI